MTRGAVALLITVLLAARYAGDHDIEPVVIDPTELESFTDEFFSTQMERLHMPGLGLVLVQNGEMVMANGYGYADLERDSAISAETMVIRVCIVLARPVVQPASGLAWSIGACGASSSSHTLS